jgi:hypothetical protein
MPSLSRKVGPNVQAAPAEAAAAHRPHDNGSSFGTDGLADLAIQNPAPDASPVREPVGTYRIFKLT